MDSASSSSVTANDQSRNYLPALTVLTSLFFMWGFLTCLNDILIPHLKAAFELKPGKPYLVEVVVRTLGLGHPFSQGTVDSNEIWVELVAKSGKSVALLIQRDDAQIFVPVKIG